MSESLPASAVSAIRVDGRRVLFEVREADLAYRCAISLNALQDISARRYVKPAEVLHCFALVEGKIVAAVQHKLRTRALPAGGLLNLWSDDFE